MRDLMEPGICADRETVGALQARIKELEDIIERAIAEADAPNNPHYAFQAMRCILTAAEKGA